MLYLFIHSIHLHWTHACARHCAQCWGYIGEQKMCSQPSGAHHIVGKRGFYQIRKKTLISAMKKYQYSEGGKQGA